MKKLLTPLLITTQVGATNQFSTAKNQFNQDSVARRMLIEDGIDGRLNIKTVEDAYKYATPGKDLERAMWLALMKDPTLLEDYMNKGMGKEVKVVYDSKSSSRGMEFMRGSVELALWIGVILFYSWVDYHQRNNQIIINSNGK